LIKEMLAVAIVRAYMDIGIGREKAGAILPHGRRGETLKEIEQRSERLEPDIGHCTGLISP
jgi:hypothetical protein